MKRVSYDLLPMRLRVGKVPFEISSLDNAVQRVVTASLNGERLSVRLSNAYCVALASKNPEYARLLNDGGLNYPDGAPVVFFMRLRKSGVVRPHRVRGPSLFRATLDPKNSRNLRHFFLGTTADTLAKLVDGVKKAHPEIAVSGSFSPPFGDLDESFYLQCVQQIESTDAQLVWVALGTPKQDFVAAELSRRTGRPCVAVGAAFDFVAGTVKEAPQWVQQSGLEWGYRFATEPRRLWRRYIFGNVRFVWSAFFESNVR